MSTSINNTIVCNEPHANLDVYYGPYDNIDAALEALSDVTIAGVTYHKRHVGLTIGIWNMAKTDITEYWFKGGISDSNLTEKSSGGGGGGLPGNIKVVTFDKNGATGTQNSVLTDNDSKVCLPQPTIVLSGSAFAGWRYGSSTHQAGDSITIGTETVVQAQWSGSQTHRVSWTLGSGITDIHGFDVTANRNINNNAQVEIGHTVRLTATVDSGYTFTNWTGGVTSTNNPVEFSVGGSDITVTANAVQCILIYTYNDCIDRVSAQYSETGEIINTGDIVKVWADVTLEAVPKRDCEFTEWAGLPSGVDPTQNPITFNTVAGTMYIEANGKSVTSECVVDWQLNEGIVRVSCINTATGERVEQRSMVPIGTQIQLTAEITDGYKFSEWSGLPEAATPTDNPVTFDIYRDIIAVPSAVLIPPRYTVKWNENEHSEINAYVNGIRIENNTELLANTQVTLEAILDTGYEFISWSGLPSGIATNTNPITFGLTQDANNITANVQESTRTYVLNITNGDGVDHSEVTVNGDNKGSVARLDVAANADVIIESFPQSEYTISGWEFVPEIPTTQTGDSVEFNMSDNIEVTVNATKNGFYYYGTNTNDNGAKGEAGEGNTKWFTDVKQLILAESNSQRIEENEFNYIYVVCNSENVPICTCEELENPIKFVPLDYKCGDNDVYNYFARIERWIEENSNRTQGPLASKGQYIYILIDSGLELKSKNITIALSNE